MEQLVYTVASGHCSTAALSSAGYLRLLQARLASFEALAESLIASRTAFMHSDLDAIMQSVEIQSSHCNEITRAEEGLAHYANQASGPDPKFLSLTEAERTQELLQRTVAIKHAVQQLNRTHAGLIRKSTHNNAVLRNMFATALVYADPRLAPDASCGRTEE